MKQQVKKFGQFLNENEFRGGHGGSVGVELGFGQTLQEYADYFAHLASIAPDAILMDIKVEDSRMNPNAMAVMTLTGDARELRGLEEFSADSLGDSDLDSELRYRGKGDNWEDGDYGRGY
jgi:hypothetical protein